MSDLDSAQGDNEPECRECGPHDQPQFSDRELEYLIGVSDELRQAIADVEAALQGDAARIAAELAEAQGAVSAVLSEVSGQVQIDLDTAQGTVDRLVTRIVGEIDRPMMALSDELYATGIVVPFTWGQQANALHGDPIDMLLDAIPALGPQLGVAPGQGDGGSADAGQLQPAQPVPDFGGGGDFGAPDQPQQLQPVPAPGGGWAVPVPVPVPGVPVLGVPVQPPVPPGAGGGAGGGGVPPKKNGCCPDPVINVTVNVPPIVVPPGADGGDAHVTFPVSGPPDPSRPSGPRDPLQPNPPNVVVEPRPIVVGPTIPQIELVPIDPQPVAPVPPRPIAPPAAPPSGPGTAPPTPVTPPTGFPPSGPTQPGVGSNLAGGVPLGELKPTNRATPDWNNPGVCADLPRFHDIAQKDRDGRPAKKYGPGDTGFNNTKIIGDSSLGDITERFFGTDARDRVSGWVDQLAFDPAKLYDDVQTTIIGQGAMEVLGLTRGNYATTVTYHGSKVALAAQAEARTMFPFSYLATADQLALQYWAPQYLPSQSMVDAAYLTRQISEQTWECWTRAHGNLPEPARRALLSQQTKPGISEVVQLYQRGLLRDDDLFGRMRDLGVLAPAYAAEWVELAKVLPTMTDLLRFMVRDAADQKVVDQYQLDAGFSEKYAGQIKVWAKALGLPEDVFKYFWRSHWNIPSYTQLSEMLHRLRPGRAEVVEWHKRHPEWLPGMADPEGDPRPLEVTAADVKRALLVNDMMPGWVDSMMQISYNPITRTDAIRAFEIGAFDESQLREAYLDNGYSPRDADILVRYTQQLKARRQSNVTNTWTIRKVVRYYKQGAITRGDAIGYMQPLQPDVGSIRRILDAADQELDADLRREKMAATKRQFVRGDLSIEGLGAVLAELGLDADQSGRLASTWLVQRDSKYKAPTLKMLREWFDSGYIGADEWYRRLRNLGYRETDAKMIIAQAVGLEDDGGGVSVGDITIGAAKAIQNAVMARRATDKRLGQRADQLAKELTRVRKELNKRRGEKGDELLEPIRFD